ncbi:5-methyltetrahydrofolate--homocysteine methyltransferase [Sphingorhabdus soli]|uniref:Methionine synthase n=1 Tax=Flavisphingopyxis soli TaxID=2601267 RepID=A0A5C6U7R9_9SPHN|nr:homocysteine S-methyltransferase family protein [Sphingorhabdus soli]TXC67765.1 5-methyltetrahydrofolate--homocysteine methyltransferase [Sphingorhabdus soli]
MTSREAFHAAAAERILIKDGPFGTELQRRDAYAGDFASDLGLSADQRGNGDMANLARPDIVGAVIDDYLAAGADLIATNTFNANRVSQSEYGAEHLVGEINRAAARIARERVDAATASDGRPRFVAGALGPTNKTLSLSPDVGDPGFRAIDFDTLKDVYREQAEALAEGGADFILVETVFDTLNAKAAIFGTLEAEQALGRELPLMLSMTLTDLSGRNLSGHTIEAFWYSVRHARPLTIGLNCSFGAEQLRSHVKQLSAIADTLVMAYPNAGLPNDLGEYDEEPQTTAGLVRDWAAGGLVNVLGGCCGSRPDHIAAMAKAVAGLAPRAVPAQPVVTRLAGLEPFTLVA